MRSKIEGAKGYRRLIPSMTALVGFEAVARLGSFTIAADELGVTQAAVSRQIRSLEETLETRLFHRLHRSIELTTEGESLYLVVAESMQKIAGVFDRLSKGAEQNELVLATTAAFSHFRLLPRLHTLKRWQSNLKLRLTTQMFTADLRHNEIDVAVRFGNGRWRDGTSILMFDEEVFPVCSPRWLDVNGVPETVADLARMPLIESDATSEGWMTWAEWFDAVGAQSLKLQYAFRCSLYTDAIEAARYGEGVALGWSRLVDGLLKTGELVRLMDVSFRVPDSYFIVVPHGRPINSTIHLLIDWLCADAAIISAAPEIRA